MAAAGLIVPSMTRLGLLLAAKGRPGEAEAFLRQAIRSGDAEAMNYLAQLLAGRGQHGEAEGLLRGAVSGGNVAAAIHLAAILAERGSTVRRPGSTGGRRPVATRRPRTGWVAAGGPGPAGRGRGAATATRSPPVFGAACEPGRPLSPASGGATRPSNSCATRRPTATSRVNPAGRVDGQDKKTDAEVLYRPGAETGDPVPTARSRCSWRNRPVGRGRTTGSAGRRAGDAKA